jgi:hypothetical protein
VRWGEAVAVVAAVASFGVFMLRRSWTESKDVFCFNFMKYSLLEYA